MRATPLRSHGRSAVGIPPRRRRGRAVGLWIAAAFVLACKATPTELEAQPAGEPQAPTAEKTIPIRGVPAHDLGDPATAVGANGAVASAEANASDIGVAILKRGGNAIDAAVAVGFALAVTHPSAGNLGGGGFMVIRLADGTSLAIDYRERAPKAAHRDMYLDAKGEVTRGSLDGALAAGIPGTVAGLALAHEGDLEELL